MDRQDDDQVISEDGQKPGVEAEQEVPEEDPYKDYYTTNIFEGMKKADPRVLTAVGIIAVVLAVVIILVFGGK